MPRKRKGPTQEERRRIPMTREQWIASEEHGAEQMKVFDHMRANKGRTTNFEMIDLLDLPYNRDHLRPIIDPLKTYLMVNHGISIPRAKKRGAKSKEYKATVAKLEAKGKSPEEIKKLLGKGVFVYELTKDPEKLVRSILARGCEVIGRIRKGVRQDAYGIAKNAGDREYHAARRVIHPILMASCFVDIAMMEAELQGYNIAKIKEEVAAPLLEYLSHHSINNSGPLDERWEHFIADRHDEALRQIDTWFNRSQNQRKPHDQSTAHQPQLPLGPGSGSQQTPDPQGTSGQYRRPPPSTDD